MKTAIALATGLALALPAFCPAASYTITDLGALGPLGSASQGHAMNNNGDVTGWSQTIPFNNNYPFVHGFVFSGGVMHDIGVDPADPLGRSLQGDAINDSGQVVGHSDSGRAFTYSGGVTSFLPNSPPTLPIYSTANGINNHGVIVGQGSFSNNTAYLLDAFGPTVLPGFSGDPHSNSGVANAINDSGQVTGGGVIRNNSIFPAEKAFLYSGGAMTNLDPLDIYGGSQGLAINALGDVVGALNLFNSTERAFLYTGGAIHVLGTLGGVSVAKGINASGQIVGDAIVFPSNINHAFLYSGGVMQDLNSLVTLPPGGMYLADATAINDSGQILANMVIDTNGTTHPVILTPTPEPSSVVLAALGFLGVAAWGRRRHRQSA